MRGRAIILTAFLITAAAVPDTLHAQLSPQGVIGGITRPIRQMFGHFGHYPRVHRHRAPTAARRAVAAAPLNEVSVVTGPQRLGSVGPPVWPSVYEDVLGFTFWPDDYASRLRSRGFDVIANTIIGRYDLPSRRVRTATTDTAVRSDADNDSSADQCADSSIARPDWPAARIQKILQLSDTEHDALEKLQDTVGQGIKGVGTGCQSPGALPPPDRLRALVQILWAVRDAGILVRDPLKSFNETLTSTQKNNFTSQQPQQSAPDSKTADAGMNRQYRTCASQNAEKAERLIKEIEMKVRPKKDQAVSLENFRKASSDMAKLLIAACVRPIPADPLARLDAANDQLTAINYAATTVQIAFDDFYSRLDNEQKARFNAPSR